MTDEALGPGLRRIVERARAQAHERGELLTMPSGFPPNPLSPEAQAALVEWVASGDYDRIVAEITDGDPDISTQ